MAIGGIGHSTNGLRFEGGFPDAGQLVCSEALRSVRAGPLKRGYRSVDCGGVDVSSSPMSGSLGAMAAGVRGSLDAQNLRSVLDVAGIEDDALRGALSGMSETSVAVAAAAAEIARLEGVGTLIDIIA